MILINIDFLSANLQKDQICSNNSSAVADELFECVWPLLGLPLKEQ